MPFEPNAADREGVSAIGCESRLIRLLLMATVPCLEWDSNLGPKAFPLLEFEIAP